ncbi:ankyrin repeat and SAM domain-containing protein 6-like isoform X2 [Actinia tenebrosa]|uniref:Ankyrin repeat and SAM domain-containing protein 6-like isoform X2 n=1 Tax=Actinia tenebrosa TaxID=6105 RepID=A0A6P8I7S1_ACTTE|nr:ankyrin repeat and SAM domain-containing protein 6-like isoform X2 [Actinia tenebrosa]
MDQIRKLLHAAEQGNVSAASDLLDQGVHVDSTDEEGVSALHTASANGHDNMVRLLLSRGASFDTRNGYGWTPLMIAACYGHLMIVGILLQHKADICATNDLGATALDCAARSGHVQVVLLLIEASSDYEGEQQIFLSNNCFQALLIACQHGHEQVVKLLLEKGTDVNYQDEVTGWTPLMFASLNGHMSVVQELCEYGADTNSTNILHQTALEIAAIRQRSDVETFLDRKTTIRPQVPGQKMFRPSIIEAARSGDIQGLRELLEMSETDVNATDEDGATPLMFASMRGHLNVAHLLIEKGCNINSQDKISGWTALMQATYYRHKQVVKLLLDHSADVNIQADDGCTAFDMASIIGDTDILRLLASVTMQLPSNNKNKHGLISWATGSMSKLDTTTKMNTQDISTKELAKLEAGPDLGKTGLKMWWSKMSSRLRNLTLVRTIRVPSTTKRDSSSSLESNGQEADLLISNLNANESLKTSRVLQRNSLSSDSDSHSTTRSLASGGHYSKRSKTLPLGSPKSRLPDDVISPVVPPSMPAPAFELTRVQREPTDDDDSLVPQVPCLCINGKSIPEVVSESKCLAADNLDNISSVSGYSVYRRRHGDGFNFSGSPESSYSTASFLSSASNNSGGRTLKATSSNQMDSPSKPTSMSSLRHKNSRPSNSPSPTLISVTSAASAPGRLHPSSGLSKPTKLTPVLTSRSDDGGSTPSINRVPIECTDEEEVTDILKKLSLEKYNSMFEEQEVDMEAFLTLKEVDLKELGVTQRDARQQILSAIQELNSGKDRERQQFRESISDGCHSNKSQLTSGYGSGSPSTSMNLSRWAMPSGTKNSRLN